MWNIKPYKTALELELERRIDAGELSNEELLRLYKEQEERRLKHREINAKTQPRIIQHKKDKQQGFFTIPKLIFAAIGVVILLNLLPSQITQVQQHSTQQTR